MERLWRKRPKDHLHHNTLKAPFRCFAMKVVVVGPIYPLRGGIAHSNRALCEALAHRHEVTALSFSRLYPQFLFPGKEQREKNKDPDFKIKTRYWLDSVNPFSWISAAKRIRMEQPEWVVFHWWHTAFVPCYWTLAWFLKKNPKTKITIVCHNFLPHDQTHGFHFFFLNAFFRQADCLVSFSKNVLKELQNAFPSKPSGWIIEPSYVGALGDFEKVSKATARKELRVSGNCLLFFGFVRPYKGLDYLLEALPQVLEKTGVTVIIAGEFWGGKEAYEKKIKDLGIGEKVVVFDEYIPNSKVPVFFAAADALVLPYVSSTNSAVLKMAYGFDTPVIASRLEAHEDLIENHKTGILVEPRDSKALAEAIIRFFEKKEADVIKEGMEKKRELFEWNADKEKILFNTVGKTH